MKNLITTIVNTFKVSNNKNKMSKIVESFVNERNFKLLDITRALDEGRVEVATCKVSVMNATLNRDLYGLINKLRKYYTMEEVLHYNYDIYLYVQNNLHIGCQQQWRNCKTHYLYNEFLKLLRQALDVDWYAANGKIDKTKIFYFSSSELA
jgi:hypothetical protein